MRYIWIGIFTIVLFTMMYSMNRKNCGQNKESLSLLLCSYRWKHAEHLNIRALCMYSMFFYGHLGIFLFSNLIYIYIHPSLSTNNSAWFLHQFGKPKNNYFAICSCIYFGKDTAKKGSHRILQSLRMSPWMGKSNSILSSNCSLWLFNQNLLGQEMPFYSCNKSAIVLAFPKHSECKLY